jgi:NADPH:quinone reductase-like Zn-dependent oxidoreductase
VWVTVIDLAAVRKHGVRFEGNHSAAEATVLAGLLALVDAGRLTVPIAGVHALEEVQDAFRELERRHTHGKIVLRP